MRYLELDDTDGDRERDALALESPPLLPGTARVTSSMVALAWSVVHCPEDRVECAHVLATLVIDAAQATPAGPGRP